MRSIQTRILLLVSVIIIVVVVLLSASSIIRTTDILDGDSETIIKSVSEYYVHDMNDSFMTTEQSVSTLYNYAIARAQIYSRYDNNDEYLDDFTYDISELGKSIAENTPGAMAIYARYNPETFGPTAGFWYTIDVTDGTWNPAVPTDMSLYEKDEIQHVGWYYIPIERGEPMWMEPYYNANLGINMISYIIPYYYEGLPVGIYGMDINMDLIKERVSKIRIYESGHAFVLDKAGDIIYHRKYPDGLMYEDIPETDRHFFSEVLELEENKPTVFKGLNGIDQKIITSELRNGMIFGVAVPVSEIAAPQWTLLKQILTISFVILLLGLAVTFPMVRSVTEPLKKMTAVAQQYADGDFQENMAVTSGSDEVVILSRTIQAMSTSLKEQAEIADSASKAKTVFLSNMSHEFRTPINAIIGMNDMIRRSNRDKEIAEYSDSIKEAGEQLLAMVENVLTFSKISDVEALQDFSRLPRLGYTSPNIDIQYRINGARILIVDDNEINCKVADNLLNIVGVFPDIAQSGEEALKLIREKEYHLIFLDHMMPDMDGIETLRAMREENLLPEYTKIVVLTANAIEGAKDFYISKGFDDYLSKPIELKNLLDVMLRFLPKELFADSHDVVLEFDPVEDNEETAEIKEEFEQQLTEAGFNTDEGLKYCVGNMSFYTDMLSDYAKAEEKKSAELDRLKEAGNLPEYQILIHSVKSASKTVGADSIYEKAFALEEAAANKDMEFIETRHEAFILAYKAVADSIRQILGGNS